MDEDIQNRTKVDPSDMVPRQTKIGGPSPVDSCAGSARIIPREGNTLSGVDWNKPGGLVGSTNTVRGAAPRLRNNGGKPQLRYITMFPKAVEGHARIMEMGHLKYNDDEGWKRYPEQEIIDSLLRHLFKLQNGERWDIESQLDHRAHVVANALMLMENHGQIGPVNIAEPTPAIDHFD